MVNSPLGGSSLPETISIYPTDFNYKDSITDYLYVWNSDVDILVNGIILTAEDSTEINYTDNLAVAISLINNMIDIVTSALVAFTCLSLVVSTNMFSWRQKERGFASHDQTPVIPQPNHSADR